jgi:putative DNA primase/helicase
VRKGRKHVKYTRKRISRPQPARGLSSKAMSKLSGSNKRQRGSASGLITLRASEITPKKVEWLREGVILNGRVTGIVGHPGQGKSLLITDLVAAVSRWDRPWPINGAGGKGGWCVMLAAEDDPADTIIPRLTAADADLDRVRIVTAVKDRNGAKRFLSLAADLKRLGGKIEAMNAKGRRVSLVTIDPIGAYLGDGSHRIDRNNPAHVRRVMDELAAFAAEHRLAVVFVLHRPKKSTGGALMQMAGSYEFVAGPRMNLLAVGEPNTDSHLLVPCKQNLSPGGFGYRYRIKVKKIGAGIKSPFIEWDQMPVAISADEALRAESGKGGNRPQNSAAHTWLLGLLANHPMRRKDVLKLGLRAGFTARQLRTAREALGLETAKSRVGSQTVWALPGIARRK